MDTFLELNVALLYYRDEIEEFLFKDDHAFGKYLLYLFDKNKITKEYWIDFKKFDLIDKKSIQFKSIISTFSSQFFIDFLLSLRSPKVKYLINLLTNFKQYFVNKLKESFRLKFCDFPIIPFDNDGEKFPISEILLQTKYIEYGKFDSKYYVDNEFTNCLQSHNSKFLFIGNAGSGKTCHFRKIIYQWCAKQDIFQDYIVIPLNLKEISSENFEIEIWRQIFNNQPNEDEQELIKQTIKPLEKGSKNQSKILFLFDGADECSPRCQKILDILHGRFNLSHNLIVWSQHWRARQIGKYFDIVYEIQEYSENDIFNYFEIFFKFEQSKTMSRIHQAQSLFEFLKKNKPKIFKQCSNPFIALLAAIIWGNDRREAFENLFTLYDFAVDIFFTQKLFDEEKKVQVFDLCTEIACKNLLFNKDIEKNQLLLESNFAAGLLTVSTSYYDYRKKSRIEKLKFIHTSFQEFFTAKYFINNTTENRQFLRNRIKNFYREENMTEKEREAFFERHFKVLNVLSFMKSANIDIYDEIISNNRFLSIFETSLSGNLLEIIKNGSENGMIKLSSDHFPNRVMSYVFKLYGESLTAIDFDYVDFDANHCFKLISENCYSLKRVKLHSYFHEMKLSDHFYKILNISSLENISIGNLFFTDDKDNKTKNFDGKFKNLQELSIINSNLPSFMPKFSNLIKLDVQNSKIGLFILLSRYFLFLYVFHKQILLSFNKY